MMWHLSRLILSIENIPSGPHHVRHLNRFTFNIQLKMLCLPLVLKLQAQSSRAPSKQASKYNAGWHGGTQTEIQLRHLSQSLNHIAKIHHLPGQLQSDLVGGV